MKNFSICHFCIVIFILLTLVGCKKDPQIGSYLGTFTGSYTDNNTTTDYTSFYSFKITKSNDKEMNDTYGNYTAPQLLYLTSSYLNGNGLDIPRSIAAPEKPLGISFLVKDSYSIYDYMNMAGIVRNYMDANGQAPDSIEYEGAHISYYDLLYNFAKITQNHTDAKHMGFESEYHFDKVNDSILLHIFPFILIVFVLFVVYLFLKRIRRF